MRSEGIEFAQDLHAKRVLSLARATLGVIQTASLAVAMMGAVHVSTPDRRDRLWLLNAIAVVPLTLLGAAEEALGYDRHLRTNTARRRARSLLRQGHLLHELIPTMPEHRLQPPIEGFATMLAEQPVSSEAFGAI